MDASGPSMEMITTLVLGGAAAAYAGVYGLKGAVYGVFAVLKKRRKKSWRWFWRPASVLLGSLSMWGVGGWPWGVIYGGLGGSMPTLALWVQEAVKARGGGDKGDAK